MNLGLSYEPFSRHGSYLACDEGRSLTGYQPDGYRRTCATGPTVDGRPLSVAAGRMISLKAPNRQSVPPVAREPRS